MKVIYDNCVADPWVQVAQKLQHTHGYEPVYWNGYPDDDSRVKVAAAFPKAVYQSYFDACKGIFPETIKAKSARAFINIDFLKSYAPYELQAIKMMDRMDPDRHSFNFMERQRHYRKFLKYWTACIEHFKPDLLVSGNVPHLVFDYSLFLLCKFNHVKFVTFCASSFLGRTIPLTDVSSIGSLLDEEYAKTLKSGAKIDELKRSLPSDILERYEKIKMDYAQAEPEYMKEQLLKHRQSSGLFKLARKLLLDMRLLKDSYFGRDGFFVNGIPTFFKQRHKSIEASNSSVFNYAIMKVRTNAYKNKLRACYDSLVQEPDLNVPFVLVNLHYQPEMSSNPSGDIFVDQLLFIEVLAKHLPAGYAIYVKEHPSQFHAHLAGHTSRILEFYHDLAAYPQVRLLPLLLNPLTLIRNSRAVATVSGTSGWEAMVLGKPVISFGLSWYEKYAGILKIVDEKTAAMIPQFIDQFNFDERNLLAYLNAFSCKSVKAYAHRDWKDKMHQDESECVANLADCVMQMSVT
ncbi:MAG: hypothetical protein JXI33_05195 [Candidatus Aminicenantes bacterium]|nr:hypothetical protein [Candidatus Aminicenantes bacterium]